MTSSFFRFTPGRSTPAWTTFEQTKAYDLVAALPLFGWFALTAYHQAADVASGVLRMLSGSIDFALVISLLGKLVALAFIVLLLGLVFLRQPARAKARGLMPRISAVFGSYLGVAIVWLPPQPAGFGLSLLSLVLTLGGIGFAVYALFHLGRSFSVMSEARGLVTDGPYAIIRHPLYLGEAVALLGLTLQYLAAFTLIIVALQITFQLMRIRNEERVLMTQFPEYRDYQARTARLVPGLY